MNKNYIEKNIIDTLINNMDIVDKFFRKRRQIGKIFGYGNIISYYKESKYIIETKDFNNIKSYTKNEFLSFIGTQLEKSDKKSFNGIIAKNIYDYIIKYKSLNNIINEN